MAGGELSRCRLRREDRSDLGGNDEFRRERTFTLDQKSSRREKGLQWIGSQEDENTLKTMVAVIRGCAWGPGSWQL